VIPGYGTVVLRREKEAFLTAVKRLETAVQMFSERVKASIQDRIEQNVAELVDSLLPGLAERPPQEMTPSSGERLTKEEVRSELEHVLREAFGTADQLIRGMSVRCTFKGVTYELLNEPDFIEAATRAIPELERFHQEFEAATQAPDSARGQGAADV
jgi:hypothetical protein